MDNFIIKTTALTKQYNDQTVVKGVSMAIPKGKIYGLLGRNGAGKTTIMKILLGLAKASSGEVRLVGQAPVNTRRFIQELEILSRHQAFIRIYLDLRICAFFLN